MVLSSGLAASLNMASHRLDRLPSALWFGLIQGCQKRRLGLHNARVPIRELRHNIDIVDCIGIASQRSRWLVTAMGEALNQNPSILRSPSPDMEARSPRGKPKDNTLLRPGKPAPKLCHLNQNVSGRRNLRRLALALYRATPNLSDPSWVLVLPPGSLFSPARNSRLPTSLSLRETS